MNMLEILSQVYGGHGLGGEGWTHFFFILVFMSYGALDAVNRRGTFSNKT